MMDSKKIISFFFLLHGVVLGYSQQPRDTSSVEGEVTFITSSNVYIRFGNTEYISLGDTLFKGSVSRTPCLKIIQKSSTSVVGTKIQDCDLKVGGSIFVHIPESSTTTDSLLESEQIETSDSQSDPKVAIVNQEEDRQPPGYKQSVRARISGATYSSLDSLRDRHRMMLRFSLAALNINNSKLSFETFANYRKNFIGSNEEYSRQTSFFRVYNMALKYEVTPQTTVILGRKINNRASSLGALDGLQVEQNMANLFAGVIVGFRPDIIEFDFNPKLFQYGIYGGFKSTSDKFYSETTLGFLEHRNSGGVDRRYGYLQHSSNINRNIDFFSSMEIDLFSGSNSSLNGNLRITSLYTSLRYRFSRNLSMMMSYDTRKRIIFYETFRTEVEDLLADDIARQGLRFRVNFRPVRLLNLGLGYSLRFQSNQQNEARNLNGFINFSRIPRIGGSMSVNFNLNRSNYLQSRIYSFRHNRHLFDGKVNVSAYYRLVNYNYFNREIISNQSYYGASLSIRLPRKMSFSLLGEVSSREGRNSYRINTRIIKRFYAK